MGLRARTFSLPAFLLLVVVVTACVAIWGPSLRRPLTIRIRLPGTVDIERDCEIRKSGVLVGTVQSIERLPDGDYLMTASLGRDFGVSKGEVFAYLPRAGGLPGYIAIIYPDGLSSSSIDWETLGDGATVKGRVITGPEAEMIRQWNE